VLIRLLSKNYELNCHHESVKKPVEATKQTRHSLPLISIAWTDRTVVSGLRLHIVLVVSTIVVVSATCDHRR
jgi:hypothetical protein